MGAEVRGHPSQDRGESGADRKPGVGDAWRLAVKRGRDGKAQVALAPRPEKPQVRLDGTAT